MNFTVTHTTQCAYHVAAETVTNLNIQENDFLNSMPS